MYFSIFALGCHKLISAPACYIAWSKVKDGHQMLEWFVTSSTESPRCYIIHGYNASKAASCQQTYGQVKDTNKRIQSGDHCDIETQNNQHSS